MLVGYLSSYMISNRYNLITQEYIKSSAKKRFQSAKVESHEQNNKLVKIDGGATDLLNDNAALLKWTVARPEIAEMVRSFRCNDAEDTQIPHYHKVGNQEFPKRFDNMLPWNFTTLF